MQPRLLRSPARLAGASLLRLQSDERLVTLARDGHEQAFAAIVERYQAPLERYARRIAGTERAEDAVQTAFVSAHRALVSDPERSIELRPWLYRIVHNASLNQLRGARDDAPLDAAAFAALPDDAIERREQLREALDAVAALPPTQRDAILLRELEGRSHEEIAAALGVSKGAARQYLFRARGALRAAVTALTPYPLLERLLAAATGSGAAEAVAAGGAGALLVKASAGVLATGALVGGAVGTGVVHTHSHAARPEAAQAAPAPRRTPRLVRAPIADRAVIGVKATDDHVATAHHGRRHDGHGRGDDHGRHGFSGGSGSGDDHSSRHSGSGEGERHGSQSGGDDGGHSGSGGGDGGRSGSGGSDDGGHGGSLSSGSGSTSGSGGDDGGHSGSGSSGDSGGSGSGNDGAPLTTTSGSGSGESATTPTTTTDDHSGSDSGGSGDDH